MQVQSNRMSSIVYRQSTCCLQQMWDTFVEENAWLTPIELAKKVNAIDLVDMLVGAVQKDLLRALSEKQNSRDGQTQSRQCNNGINDCNRWYTAV